MTFTISKTKLAICIMAVAMLIPSGAMAFHVFDDVPDDKFYAVPVEWAFDNGITTGKTVDLFAPDDAVTRGESVTFLKRYNDNVVEPADDGLQAGIDANADDATTNAASIAALQTTVAALADATPDITVMHYNGSNTDSSVSGTYEYVRDLGTFTKNEADTDMLISMTGHSRVASGFCHWQIRVDGATNNGDSGTTYSGLHGANAVQYETGALFTQGLFTELAAGSHDVEVWLRGLGASECEFNDGNFGHDAIAIEFTT